MPIRHGLSTPTVPGRGEPYLAYTVDLYGDDDGVEDIWDTTAAAGVRLAAAMTAYDSTSGLALLPGPCKVRITCTAPGVGAGKTSTFSVVGYDRLGVLQTVPVLVTQANTYGDAATDLVSIVSVTYVSTGGGGNTPGVAAKIGWAPVTSFVVHEQAFAFDALPLQADIYWSSVAIPSAFWTNAAMLIRAFGKWMGGVQTSGQNANEGQTIYVWAGDTAVEGDAVLVTFWR